MRFNKRMWNKLCYWPLLATIFSCLPSGIRSQQNVSAEFFQNLTCVTHDAEYLVCYWNTPLPTNTDIVYDICYSSSEPRRCFQTNENRLKIEFKTFTYNRIQIKSTTEMGPVEINFQKTEQDVALIPHTPEITFLDSDNASDVLNVTWRWNTSSCLDGVAVKWEIQTLLAENLTVIQTEELKTTCAQTKAEFQWRWTSAIPLACIAQSVRIRCFVNEEYYDGDIMWSEWSERRTVYGSSDTNVMYPEDKVVPVGSNVTFCCIVETGQVIQSLQFRNTIFQPSQLSKNTSAIQLQNMNMSEMSGDNLFCHTQQEMYRTGTVIFVGYPPDQPHNFSCETHDLKKIACTWIPGRSTNLFGDRATVYTLYESYSRINISCKEDHCIFNASKGQNLYRFLLKAINPLGQSEASLVINLTERINLRPPAEISIREKSPSEVSLAWRLPAKLASLQLLCEIETKPDNGGARRENKTFSGLDDSFYNYSVTDLHPYHGYEFRVRCAATDPFWKWSEWSAGKKHHTSSAAPSRKPEIWRDVMRSSEKLMITVYWRPLSTNEANGPVNSYKVSWKPLGSNTPPKYDIVSDTSSSSKQIDLLNGDKADYEISVVANNSAGLSPPSRITTVELPSDNVKVEQQVGTADGFNITWPVDPNVTCGHVIQWRPTFPSQSSKLLWNRLPSQSTSSFIRPDKFLVGVRYNVSVFGCKENKYQLLKMVTGYTQELAPRVAPNFTVEGTTSNSVRIKWEAIPKDDLQGFLQGYLVYIVRQENNTPVANFRDLVVHAGKKMMKNITNSAQTNLTIGDLQGGTSYYLGLQAYTRSGEGPIKLLNVVTNDNALGLILAILIPIVVAILLGILTSTICYYKREWIKETFYPEIPNPENSKALQFQKNVSEANKNVKVLEMNPCTPNNVEIVQTFPKVLDTELNSPITGDLIKLPEDGLDTDENHTVVSYCPPANNEDTSNAELDQSGLSSQVVYIDIQSMYQPQANSEEEPENDLDSAGYKPQMHLAVNTVIVDTHASTEEATAEASGYRPQENPESWAVDSPGSPTSLESNNDNASFGSPCSVNSRHFLIPPVDDKDSLKPAHVGWSISSLFQNKQGD
ncbi:leukemia inhibitory factor receptor [Pelodytes ibericus]